jgi:hypothetical protein
MCVVISEHHAIARMYVYIPIVVVVGVDASHCCLAQHPPGRLPSPRFECTDKQENRSKNCGPPRRNGTSDPPCPFQSGQVRSFGSGVCDWIIFVAGDDLVEQRPVFFDVRLSSLEDLALVGLLAVARVESFDHVKPASNVAERDLPFTIRADGLIC